MEEYDNMFDEFRDRIDEFQDNFQRKMNECRNRVDFLCDALQGRTDEFRRSSDVLLDEIDEFYNDFHGRIDEFQDSMEEVLEKMMDKIEDTVDEFNNRMDAGDSLHDEIPEETPFLPKRYGNISVSQTNGRTTAKHNGKVVYESTTPVSLSWINGDLYINGEKIPIHDDKGTEGDDDLL